MRSLRKYRGIRLGPFVFRWFNHSDREMFSEYYNLVPVWRLGKLRIIYRPIK